MSPLVACSSSFHDAVLAAAGASLAPAVVEGIVGALGFTKDGIQTGSTAAKWMTTGHGVTPVAVSVLQAVGATGTLTAGGEIFSLAVVAAGAALAFPTIKGVRFVVAWWNGDAQFAERTLTHSREMMQHMGDGWNGTVDAVARSWEGTQEGIARGWTGTCDAIVRGWEGTQAGIVRGWNGTLDGVIRSWDGTMKALKMN